MRIPSSAKGASANFVFCIMPWASAVDWFKGSTATLFKACDCTCTKCAARALLTVLSYRFLLALLYKMKLVDSVIKRTSPKLVCD